MTWGPAFSSGQPGVPVKPGMWRRGPSSPKRKMLVLSPRKPRARTSEASAARSSRVSIGGRPMCRAGSPNRYVPQCDQ